VTNYYPFGAPYADSSAVKNSDYQPYKFNGKEFDKMYGLNTYDYGARQYNPVTGRWDRIDPLAEKYYTVSPYAYCANNPVRFVDLHGDSLTIDEQSILAIYNGLEDGSQIHMKFNNGVLDPSSISDAASSTNDIFLQDLYEIAINPQMVEIKVADANTYIMDGKYIQDETWTTPYDIDYSKEFPLTLNMPSGLTIAGNTGQTLLPLNVGKGPKYSTNKNIQIIINGKSRNINHQTIGIGHEFGHVVLFLRGMKYSHPDHDVDSFINIRVNTLKNRLGYDN
jgi:RHS repeat-associated protein